MSETNGNPLLPPEEIRKLLGGYATGTLNEAERKLLFEAALDDQELFTELMQEDELREALEVPGAKADILAGLGEPRVSWLDRVRTWLVRPIGLAIAGSAVAALVLVVGFNQQHQRAAMEEFAMNRLPAPVPAPTSVLKDEADKLGASLPDRPPEPKPSAARAIMHRPELASNREFSQREKPEIRDEPVSKKEDSLSKDQAKTVTGTNPGGTFQPTPQQAQIAQQKQQVGESEARLDAGTGRPRAAAASPAATAQQIQVTSPGIILGPSNAEGAFGSLRFALEGVGDTAQFVATSRTAGFLTISQDASPVVSSVALQPDVPLRISVASLKFAGSEAHLKARFTSPAFKAVSGYRAATPAGLPPEIDITIRRQ